MRRESESNSINELQNQLDVETTFNNIFYGHIPVFELHPTPLSRSDPRKLQRIYTGKRKRQGPPPAQGRQFDEEPFYFGNVFSDDWGSPPSSPSKVGSPPAVYLMNEDGSQTPLKTSPKSKRKLN